MSDNEKPGPFSLKRKRFDTAEKCNEIGDIKIKVENENESSDEDILITPMFNAQNGEIKKEYVSDMRDIPFTMKRIFFTKPPPKKPIEYFRLIINDEVLTTLVKNTNLRANADQGKGAAKDKERQGSPWNQITLKEMERFLGLLLHTGTIGMRNIEDYWKTHYLVNLPCFSTIMTLDRFCSITKYLSMTLTKKLVKKQLSSIGVLFVLNHFNERMNYIYYPGKQLVLYESEDFLHGEETNFTKCTQLHALKEPDGGVIKFHFGTYNKQNFIALSLLQEKLNKGHSVYIMDSTFNSEELATTLLDKYTYYTSLTKLDNLIPAKKNDLLERYENRSVMFKNVGIHIGKWKDGRGCDFTYITTEFGECFTPITLKSGKTILKPAALVKHKQYMRDVDQNNDIRAYDLCIAKDAVWQYKMFIHILQTSMFNSYLLYNKYSEQKITLHNFRIAVLEELLPTGITMKTFYTVHKLTKIKKVVGRQRKDRSGVTRFSAEISRRFCKGCTRNRTPYECRGCDDSPAYCIECFFATH